MTTRGTGTRLSKDEYEARVRAILETLGSGDLERLGPLEMARTMLELALRRPPRALVRRLERGIRRAADELSLLRPPEHADGAHERLVAGLRVVADRSDEVAELMEQEMRAADAGAAADAREPEWARPLRHAAEELERLGYDLGEQPFALPAAPERLEP